MVVVLRREERDRLVEAARLVAVARLIPSVAHKVGTPLAAIALRIESLDRAMETPADIETVGKVRRHLQAMREEAFRCKDILSTLQLFAQPHGADMEWVDLGDLCRSAVELIQHEAMRRQVKIVSHVGHPAPTVRGERTRLGQAILALLDNALAASPAHGVVEVEARSEAGHATVLVMDQGPGVPGSVRDGLFKPLVSSRSPQSGTGLGLTACQEIATAYGGAITWESRDRGTRFALNLPLGRQPGP